MERQPNGTEKFRQAGFSPAATLMCEQDQPFEFHLTDCDLRNVIYVYVDVETGRVLNVGHTGQPLRHRLRSYQAWLNGRRTKEINRPIRLKWLDCLSECSSVEVWARPSFDDRVAREEDEAAWIERLHPVLNVRSSGSRQSRNAPGRGKRNARGMTKIYLPSFGPTDWQRLLADPVKHWRVGYSAMALANCWEAAQGLPSSGSPRSVIPNPISPRQVDLAAHERPRTAQRSSARDHPLKPRVEGRRRHSQVQDFRWRNGLREVGRCLPLENWWGNWMMAETHEVEARLADIRRMRCCVAHRSCQV
jgi:hypothetical protein